MHNLRKRTMILGFQWSMILCALEFLQIRCEQFHAAWRSIKTSLEMRSWNAYPQSVLSSPIFVQRLSGSYHLNDLSVALPAKIIDCCLGFNDLK